MVQGTFLSYGTLEDLGNQEARLGLLYCLGLRLRLQGRALRGFCSDPKP